MKKKISIETQGGRRDVHVRVSGRTILVTNSTEETIYIACYFRLISTIFQENFIYRLQDAPIEIKSHQSVEVQRTSHGCFISRKAMLLFTREVSILEDRLPRFGICHISHKSIFFSRTETIVLHQGLLTTLGSINKHEETFFDGEVGNGPILVRRLPPSPFQTSVKVVNRRCHYISPHKIPIGPMEENALNNRRNFIKKSLSSYLPIKKKELKNIRVPNISVCFSGGSYRGMLASIGFLQGLRDTGLYDCISYLCGLSGSCWALGLWFASFKDGYDKMISELGRKLQITLREAYCSEVKKFVKVLKAQGKELDLPKTNLVDLYQALVTKQLFDNLQPSGYTYDFNDLNEYCHFEEGHLPFPIFTSAFKEPHNYEWMEFTPFEAGSHYMGGFVPINRFGSYFQQGEIMKEAPCLSLSRIMSFSCSVQCLTIYKLLKEVAGPQLEVASDVLHAIGTNPPDIFSTLHPIIEEDENHFENLTLSANNDIFYSNPNDIPHHPFSSDNNNNIIIGDDNIILTSESNSSSSSRDSGSNNSSIYSSNNSSINSNHNNNSNNHNHNINSSNNSSSNSNNNNIMSESNSNQSSSESSSEMNGVDKKDRKKKKEEKKKEKKKNNNNNNNNNNNSNIISISKVASTTANLVELSQRVSDKYLFRPASFPNFAYGLAGSPIKHKKFVKLVDAGFSFCLPLPPLLQVKERIPDIMIIVEMSSTPNCEVGQSLKEALEWVKARNIKIPPIDLSRARIPFSNGEQCVVFRDEHDLSVPIIVYVVLQKNSEFSEEFDPIQNMNEGGFCSTFNYRYTQEQILLLAELMRTTARSIDPIIKKLVHFVIQNKPVEEEPVDDRDGDSDFSQ